LDFFVTFKSMMNNLALNLDHFVFLVWNKPDFVVCCCVSACNAARAYKFLFKKHFAYAIYEVYPNHNKDYANYILNKYHRTIEEKKACIHCAFVISPGIDTFGRLLKLRYKIHELKIVPLFFTHNINFNFSRNKISYPVKLYYHGMLDRQRYLPEFITALHLCNTDTFHLYLRGKGPELELIKETISRLNMLSQVTLLPFLPPEQLSAASQEYDIGLSLVAFDSPNNRFLIGFKSTDYLCAGLCQFGPDSYILGNMLKKKNLGFTYKDTSVDGFAKALMNLVQYPQKIDEYKSNARTIATKEASFTHCQTEFLNNINHYINTNM
jgi:glycosyltransferase involved in cell wall biosynthesis